MRIVFGFLEYLAQLTVSGYQFGLEEVSHYVFVGVCVGLVVAVINLFGEGISRKDLKEWGWDQTIFIAPRFLVGFFMWPLFLFVTPLVVPAVMLSLIAIAMLAFGLWSASLWRRRATM